LNQAFDEDHRMPEASTVYRKFGELFIRPQWGGTSFAIEIAINRPALWVYYKMALYFRNA